MHSRTNIKHKFVFTTLFIFGLFALWSTKQLTLKTPQYLTRLYKITLFPKRDKPIIKCHKKLVCFNMKMPIRRDSEYDFISLLTALTMKSHYMEMPSTNTFISEASRKTKVITNPVD